MSNKKYIIFLQYLMCVLVIITVFPRMFMESTGIKWDRLTYYTIQTNIIMGVYWFFAAAKRNVLRKQGFEVFGLMSTVAISITGSCYFIFLHSDYLVLLKGLYESGKTTGFLYYFDLFCTYVNHLVVPVMSLIDYVIIKQHFRMEKRHMLFPLIIPFIYFVFHTVRGLLSGYFTYSFIDPEKMGGWIYVILMFFALAAFTMILSVALFAFTHRKVVSLQDGENVELGS
ncbi:MAG: Pr6Pr family membrane protein [Clostridia bacterium]|nr:Pr6Pr family membrane protein [Clostridia bacterium]